MNDNEARKQFAAQVRQDIADEHVFVNVWQRRPYTACQLIMQEFTGLGFTRCKWTDWFSFEKGYEIALGRAIKDIWDQMSVNEQPSVSHPALEPEYAGLGFQG